MKGRPRNGRRKKSADLKDLVFITLLVATLILLAFGLAWEFTQHSSLGAPLTDKSSSTSQTSTAKPESEPGEPEPTPTWPQPPLSAVEPLATPVETTANQPTAARPAVTSQASTVNGLTEAALAKAQIAFVIDDAGNNLVELEPFLALPWPITIAVLPGLPYSAEAARRVRAAGKELILHQPMEAIGGQNPGPGAIDGSMAADEIWNSLERNIAEVGKVVGINNHQGSKTTTDEAAVAVVLAFCQANGLYYLDSRTTADTVVPAVAARMGIRIGERDVFIDNFQQREEIIGFVREGLQKAQKKGAAIMIGHAWSAELANTLHELYPELIEQGFSLSTISKILLGSLEDEGSRD